MFRSRERPQGRHIVRITCEWNVIDDSVTAIEIKSQFVSIRNEKLAVTVLTVRP